MPKTSAGSKERGRAGNLPAHRKAELIAYVDEHGQVSVSALAGHFSVSMDTIRRDLDELDALGRIIRTHGGAVSADMVPKANTGVDVRARLHSQAKDAVGKIAAGLVHADATVIINGGTTALSAVAHLPTGAGLRIITNNLKLPESIAAGVADEVYMIGGAVRTSAQATTGEFSSGLGVAPDKEFDVRCDIALIGVGAVSARQGYSTGNIAEAALMRQMMNHADKVVVLADSSKLGRSVFARVGPLSLADILVTDTAPGPAEARALADAGVEVLHS